MASGYVKQLEELAELLKEEGWDRRAGIVRSAAIRMDRLEQTVIDAYDSDHKGDGPGYDY